MVLATKGTYIRMWKNMRYKERSLEDCDVVRAPNTNRNNIANRSISMIRSISICTLIISVNNRYETAVAKQRNQRENKNAVTNATAYIYLRLVKNDGQLARDLCRSTEKQLN
jgi:hypothetical protein